MDAANAEAVRDTVAVKENTTLTKKVGELEHEEIVKLTEEQVDDLVDLECAEQGVTLTEKPEKPNALKVDSEPDLSVYEIAGLALTEPGPAAEIAALVKKHRECLVDSSYDYSCGYSHKHAGDFTDKIEVTPGHILSWQKYQEIKGDLQVAEETKGDFDKELSAWTKAYDKRTKIRKDILMTVHKHKEAEDDYQRYMQVMKRYMELSNGDNTVARKFFEEAHKDDAKAKALQPRLYREFGLIIVDDGRLVRGETKVQVEG